MFGNASSLHGDPKLSDDQHNGSGALVQTAIGACVLVIFLTLLGWRIGLGERLPGDLGDSRLNMYVLEHYFRWITDGTSSFASPGMLYPYPDILFFSDTHVGTSWIYCIFRAIGLDPYMAFKAWFFTGYALTYAAAYFVFTRLASPPWIAALGAALFAFGLPSIAQFAHEQLVYRCGVPLAMFALWQWCQSGRVKSLLLSIFWLNVQMLISVYLGVFLALLMGLFCLVFFVSAPKRLLSLGDYFDVRDALRQIMLRDYFAIAAWLAVFILTLFMLYRHHEVDRHFALTRPWSEISSMLPRPASYFMSSILPYYRIVYWRLSVGIPMAHEHNMFVGVGTFGLFVAGFFGLRARRNAQFARLALVAGLLIVLMVTQFGAFSAYKVLATLPGLNAIRAVTRVILILLFPISAVAVKGMEYLCRAGAAHRIRFALCAALVLVFAIEVEASKKQTYPVSKSEARIIPLLDQAKARTAGIAHPILAVTSPYAAGFEADKAEMDGALVAQRLGWPTINGYSGSVLPGQTTLGCSRARRQYEAYMAWAGKHAKVHDPSELLKRTVYVGPLDCTSEIRRDALARQDLVSQVQTPADPSIAPLIHLTIQSVERRDGEFAFRVEIKNDSASWLWSNPQEPLRMSWNFVPLDEPAQQSAATDKQQAEPWNARQDLPDDIAPGGSESFMVTATLPKQPGLYRLQVTMVHELAFWFHDHGMQIATWPAPIKVE